MNKNLNNKIYKNTMDSIKISDDAVEKAVKNLKQPDVIGKTIEVKKPKYRIFKPIGAVAAVLALIIGAGAIFNLGNMPDKGANNSFFITANAASTDDEPVKITNEFTTIGTITPSIESNASTSIVLSSLKVVADINFNCVGNNVKTVTYKVKNGDSDGVICLFDYNTKVVDYGKVKKMFQNGYSGAMKNGVYGRYLYYDYATFDYDNQLDPDDGAQIAVGYKPTSTKEAIKMQSFLNEINDMDHKSSDMNLKEVKERIKEFYQTVFRNTEVVVTATYKDGSTESKTLKLGINNIIIYDEQDNEITNETGLYRKYYDYKLIMTAKLA